MPVAFYGKVLQDMIEGEKQGKQYRYSAKDRVVLDEMFREINDYAGTNFRYLAELDAFSITGSGPILAKYIWRIETQTARAFLIPQLVADRIKDCDKLVLDLYLDFRNSDVCTLDPERDRTVGACVRYDNAFRRLKPKRLRKELLNLAQDPRDAFRLPFTMRMLASWKLPEMYDILLRYADGANTTAPMLGFPEDTEQRRKRAAYVRRDLQFVAISGLKYYPTPETLSVVKAFAESPDIDIVLAAKKTRKSLEKI